MVYIVIAHRYNKNARHGQLINKRFLKNGRHGQLINTKVLKKRPHGQLINTEVLRKMVAMTIYICNCCVSVEKTNNLK